MGVTLDDLRAKAAVVEQELDDLKAAIRVMERIESAPEVIPASSQGAPAAPKVASDGAIDLAELILPARATSSKKETLFTELQALVERFGEQEFTVAHVNAALEGMGKSSNAKHFKNRLSMTIKKLVDEGILIRTHKGAGNTPHKYKVKRRQESLLKGVS